MKQIIIAILAIFILNSCSKEPQPIAYGDDKCDFCTMNIMDKPYGTELVTSTGKVYKFDSSECMLGYMNENQSTEFAHILTNTMDKPGELADAKTCSFLISENLPSPMGANITAFSTKALAKEAQSEYTGKVYTFDELKIVQKENGAHKHAH